MFLPVAAGIFLDVIFPKFSFLFQSAITASALQSFLIQSSNKFATASCQLHLSLIKDWPKFRLRLFRHFVFVRHSFSFGAVQAICFCILILVRFFVSLILCFIGGNLGPVLRYAIMRQSVSRNVSYLGCYCSDIDGLYKIDNMMTRLK